MCAATRTACTSPPNTATAARAASTRATVRFMDSTIRQGSVPVLEKLDLDADGRARQKALAALTMKFGGAETRERLEVVNEMRLIEIAARQRNICPIGLGTASRQVDGALKTLHPTE